MTEVIRAAPPKLIPTHIVGIGASAGGLEALERFFDNVPTETGMAFVVIQHLSPDFKSMMDERVTQNKIELRRRIVDLGSVAKDAADAVRAIMEGHGLEFTIEVAPGAIPVDGDPARLQQLQANLLSNAAKYTPRGGHVVLAVERDGDMAVVRVRDDGVGIPADMIDSVFELFVQSKRTLERAEGGLGVGLTLARSLVAMHGGTVTATSKGEGEGSEFVVRIPLARQAEAEPSASAPRLELPSGARILVVEDNADSRELLCQVLTVAGFECAGAADGASALAAIGGFAPDVAIVDIGLPGMDGFELARRLRADPKSARVKLIALTGYGQLADRAAALSAGFDEHIVKPVDADTLTRLLGRRDGQRSPRGAA